MIFDTESRIARTRSDALWQSAVDRTDGLLPLRIADRVGPRAYGHLTYLLAATASVGEMLRAVCRYYPALLGDTTQHRVETSRSRVRLTIDPLAGLPHERSVTLLIGPMAALEAAQAAADLGPTEVLAKSAADD